MRLTIAWRRRVVRAIVPVTVLSVLLGVAVVAALADGYPTKDVDLHDGGVWVTHRRDGLAGRFVVPAEELDAAVEVATATEFDVLQEGTQVFLTGAGELRRIDPISVSIAESGATVPTVAEIGLGGGVVGVVDRVDGRVWVRSAITVDSLDTSQEEPDAIVGGDAALAVGRDGLVHAVSGDTDQLVTVRLTPDGPQVSTADLGADVAQPTITAAGDRPVVLSVDGTVVLPGGDARTLPGGANQVRLQQPGPASDVVAIATADRLLALPFDGGDIETLSTDGTGVPAAPVQLGGCFYAAWSAQPVMARACPGGDPIEPIRLNAPGAASDRLEFRVNHDLIVLNQLHSGAIFTFERAGEDLGQWRNVHPVQLVPDDDKPVSEEKPPPHENTDPDAKDDKYGARPGQGTLLPVLENDGDADGDFLVIESVTGLGDGARLNIVANGQAVQLVLPSDAQGVLQFTYTVNDGRSGTDTATVHVTVRQYEDNLPPEPVANPRSITVEQGGTATFHVLTDWRDPDGDPLVLTAARTNAPDLVRFTPDGFITFIDAGVTAGAKTVTVLISDGYADPTEGTVDVTVLPAGQSSPPQPHDDRVVGFVGEPLTIEPLLNDTDPNASVPGTDTPLRLVNASQPGVGATRILDHITGKIIFTATRDGTYYLDYTVTQGTDEPASARIRIDILTTSARNPPVAVADVVVVRGTAPGVVDVLANDTDLDGDVLAISSVSVPEDSGLVVSVLEHKWLRVVAPQMLTGRVPIEYTVSDGFNTDVGVVTVNRAPPLVENQPPAPRPDVATVRVGDVVSIDVLANDVDPEGGLLTLAGTPVPEGDPRGAWYVSGSTVRYHAPDTPGTAVAHYKVLDPELREADGIVTVTIVDPEQNQRPQPATVHARVFAGTVTRVHIPLYGVDPDGDSVVLLGATHAPTYGRVVAQGIDYIDYEAYPGKGGTDSFDYRVADAFGATGTGTVRIGIIPRPAENSAPIAVDDEYVVAPGARISAPVLANDSDLDGDPLTVEPLDVPDPQVGDIATLSGNRIVVTAPTTPGDDVTVQYAVTDGRGQRSFATLRVVAREGANVPPSAEDDWVSHYPPEQTWVDVPVLDNDDDIDGNRNDLVVTVDGDDGLEWDAIRHLLRVPLGERPGHYAYQVTDAAGETAVAFVHVPALGDQAPHVRDDAEEITIASGAQLAIDLADFIVDPEGHDIRITRAEGVSSSPQPGVTVVDGSITATGLTLQADAAYSGPGTLVVEVTDGTNAQGQQATLTLPVTVAPAESSTPVAACPPVRLPAGSPEISVDLRTCVPGLTSRQREALRFTDPSGEVAGVTVRREGTKLHLSASRSATPGTSGVLRFTISGPWGDTEASMTVLVRAAALARATTDRVERAEAGQTRTVDVIRNDTNPFPDVPLRVVKVEKLAGDVTFTHDERNVYITPADDFHGEATLTYTVRDALDDPARDVLGRIIVHVVARPDTPSAPRQVSVGANRAVIAWTAPESNGAVIEEYQVEDQSGTQYPQCRTSTICEIEGLENGVGYQFRVRARNIVDWSDWSEFSPTITPDQRPGQPAAPTTQFGDGQITVRWTPPANSGTPIRYYTIEVSPGGAVTVDAARTEEVFRDLTNGTAYTFRIRAHNDAPEPGDWSPWSAPEIPAGPPATMSAPVAAGVASEIGEQISVQWVAPDDNGAPIASYTLTVVRAGVVERTQTFSGDVTSTVVDVDNGVQYVFRITATNKAGTSQPSPDSAVAVAHGKPGRITNLTVSDTGSDGHGLDRRVSYSFTAPDDNGMAISQYQFEYTNDESPDRQGITATSGLLDGLTNGQNYTFRVRACNDMCGEWSNSVSAQPYGRPNAPGATATANGQNQITFTWSVPAANGRAIDYLQWRLPGHSQYDGWQTVDPAANGSQVWSGLNPGTQRSIQVRVFDVTGWDSPVTTASATTANPPATIRISAGARVTTNCSDPSCRRIHVRMDNFEPNKPYNIVLHDDFDGNPWSPQWVTTDSNGVVDQDLTAYFGYPGYHVWGVVDGVESNHFPWPSS